MDFKKMNSEAEMGHDAKTDEETMNNVTEMKKDLKIAYDQFNKMHDQMKKSGLFDYFVKKMESRIQADFKELEDDLKEFERKEKGAYLRMDRFEELEDENIEDQPIDDHQPNGKISMRELREIINICREKTERPDLQQKGIPENEEFADTEPNPDLT